MTIFGKVIRTESRDNQNHELVLRDAGGNEKFVMSIVNGQYELFRGLGLYADVPSGTPVSAGKFQGISFEGGRKIYECMDKTGVSCRLSVKDGGFTLDTLKPLLTHKIK